MEKRYLDEDGGVSIEDARVIVAGGRGCQKAANLELLQDLAKKLGGCDGWFAGNRGARLDPTHPPGWPIRHAVGPELYIAVGISGAIQHVVGMSSSKTVIAINKDPEAAIFKTADLGVVGDAVEIIPLLSALIEEKN